MSALTPREATDAAYTEACRTVFALLALGAHVDPAECQAALAALVATGAPIGARRVDRLRETAAEGWYAETGLCPYCGTPGSFHVPPPPVRRRAPSFHDAAEVIDRDAFDAWSAAEADRTPEAER